MPPDIPANANEIGAWNDVMGKSWAMLHERLDRQIRPFGHAAMEKAGLSAGQKVLDIGCGCGETTFDLAGRVAPGEVTGLDVSAMLLEIAKADAEAKGLANVAFSQADAQVHDFTGAGFDVLFSRFGVMFFDDPQAAFANLRTALKPGGRLAFCCWRGPQENLYLSLAMRSVSHLLPPLPSADPLAPGPMAFADPDRLNHILAGAGFTDIRIEPLDVMAGDDSLDDTVFQAIRIGQLGGALRQTGVTDELKARITTALKEALTPYLVDGVVKLPGAVWIVSARNA